MKGNGPKLNVAYMVATIPGQTARRACKGKLSVGDEFTHPGHYRRQNWLANLLGVRKKLRVYRIVKITGTYVKCQYEP